MKTVVCRVVDLLPGSHFITLRCSSSHARRKFLGFCRIRTEITNCDKFNRVSVMVIIIGERLRTTGGVLSFPANSVPFRPTKRAEPIGFRQQTKCHLHHAQRKARGIGDANCGIGEIPELSFRPSNTSTVARALRWTAFPAPEYCSPIMDVHTCWLQKRTPERLRCTFRPPAPTPPRSSGQLPDK